MAGLRSTAANATKTGAYAVQVVLPGENSSQFEELKAQLMHDFDPVGMVEVAMVHDLAVLTWKRLRVDRVEHAVMLQMMQVPLHIDNLETAYGPGFLRRAMPRLEPYEPVTREEFAENTQLLIQLKDLWVAAESELKERAVRKKWPLAFNSIANWANAHAVDVGDFIEGTGRDAQRLKAVIQTQIGEALVALWLWENREAVEAAIRRVRDSRLLQYMKINNTQRAYDDIGRAFYRTLAELRRQQDWRSRRSAILVDDATPSANSAKQTNSHLAAS